MFPRSSYDRAWFGSSRNKLLVNKMCLSVYLTSCSFKSVGKIRYETITWFPSNRKWKNKTFEECVLDASDPECHINDGSIRDFYIVRRQFWMVCTKVHVNPGVSETYFQPYFCGQDLECTKHNSRWAILRAMESVDRHYPVVGVLEELEKSLMVMQSLMPRFFGGIWDLFGNGNASELKSRGE